MRFNKVFCIGMPMTGTSSLARALSILGVQTIGWLPQSEVLYQLEDGDLRLPILKEKDGLTDLIGVRWYRELDRVYPGSKFVLTIRDQDAWLNAIAELWNRDDSLKRKHAYYYYRISVFGCLNFLRDHFADVYQDHVRNAQAYFVNRPEQFLVMSAYQSEAWETLCPFLEMEIPGEPFPLPTE